MSMQDLFNKVNPDIKRIKSKTNFKLYKLQFEYALIIAKRDKISFYKSIVKNTRYLKILKHNKTKKFEALDSELKKLELNQINNSLLEKIILLIFALRKKSKFKKKHCFGYTLSKNKDFVFLHFNNEISPKNPLRGREIKNRREELRKILKEIKKKHPSVKKVHSETWLRNYPVYRSFFPDEANKKNKVVKINPDSYAIWGQFINYKGKINKRRVELFRKTWKFPLKPIKTVFDIKYLYNMYLNKE
jgi:hypothetical protein